MFTTSRDSNDIGGASMERRGGARKHGFRVTERDIGLLGFIAAHRFVLARQVQVWLGAHEVITYRRLRGLLDAGLLSYRRIFHARPGCYLITAAGLSLVESELGRPKIDLRAYRHDVGLVWVWLAAREGRVGHGVSVLSERQMRARDQTHDGTESAFAIPLGGCGRGGHPRMHYPDVVLTRADGSRIAVELELSLKSRPRLERILAGYAYEPRIARVVYLTDRPAIRDAVCDVSLSVGLDARLEIDYVAPAREVSLERAWEQLMGEVQG